MDKNHNISTLKFDKNIEFENMLHHKVDVFFDSSQLARTATLAVHSKTVFVITAFITLYVLLVFVSDSIWQGIILSVLLGFALVGIGVNLQHDGAHNAYSKHLWCNRAMAMTADLIGASSYFWKWKHNLFHHSFTNVFHFDTDIDFGMLAKVSPSTQLRYFHRWQHIYIWLLYGFLIIKWQLFDDFYSLILGCQGNHKVPRPNGFALIVFVVGKLLFIFYAFAIPLLFHSLLNVLFFYTIAMFVSGLTLSTIFVLPHCCCESEFPLPDKETGQIKYPRAVHQVRVSVDFMRKNPVVTFLIGGLNYHREHHLFPMICHVHYRKIAGIIDTVCEQFGVPHVEHVSYASALLSHYRWLRLMGRPDATKLQYTKTD